MYGDGHNLSKLCPGLLVDISYVHHWTCVMSVTFSCSKVTSSLRDIFPNLSIPLIHVKSQQIICIIIIL